MIKSYVNQVPRILNAQSRPEEFEAFHRSTMSAAILEIYDALQMKGFEASYAKNKGGGFWIKGRGYTSLKWSARLATSKKELTPAIRQKRSKRV